MESVLSRLRTNAPLTLNDILGVDPTSSDLAAADVSIAHDGSFVETSSGPAAREIKRHFDQLYGVGPSVRSPYAITAFVNQHGKPMFRVGNRELSAPAASAQEAENRIAEAQAQAQASAKMHELSSSPPRSKRRSRMSMHAIFSPTMFNKQASTLAPTPLAPSTNLTISRPQTGSSQSSHRKLRKTRSFGPGDPSVYQQQQQQQQHHPYSQQSTGVQLATTNLGSTTFSGRAHSHSVTSADVSRFTSLASFTAPTPSPFPFTSTSTIVSSTATSPSSPSINRTSGSLLPSPGLSSVSIPLVGPANAITSGLGGYSSDSVSQGLAQPSILFQQQFLAPNQSGMPHQAGSASDIFAQVMAWAPNSPHPHPPANGLSASSASMSTAVTSSFNSFSPRNQSSTSSTSFDPDEHARATLQNPFGAGVVFDSPFRRHPRRRKESGAQNGVEDGYRSRKGSAASATQQNAGHGTVADTQANLGHELVHSDRYQLSSARMLREMQSFDSTVTARQIDVVPLASRTAAPENSSFCRPRPHDGYNFKYRYSELIDGDGADLKRPPSAVRLRDVFSDSVPGPKSDNTTSDTSATNSPVSPSNKPNTESTVDSVETSSSDVSNSDGAAGVVSPPSIAQEEEFSDLTSPTMTSMNATSNVDNVSTATTTMTTTIADELLSALESDLISPALRLVTTTDADNGEGANEDTPTDDSIPAAERLPGVTSVSSHSGKDRMLANGRYYGTTNILQDAIHTSTNNDAPSRYASVPDVFDILQTYTGLPLLDRLPARSSSKKSKRFGEIPQSEVLRDFEKRNGQDRVEREEGVEEEEEDEEEEDEDVMETTVIRMSLSTKDETAAPRDDPRFVIWGWVTDKKEDSSWEKVSEGEDNAKERAKRSLRGSIVGMSDSDGVKGSQVVDADGVGKNTGKSRPSINSKKRSKKDKKEDKGKGIANEFGVVSSRDAVMGSQDGPLPSGNGSYADDGGTNKVSQAPGLEGRKVVIAATIERWVAQLTSDLDYDELLDFFLTYRTYVSATDLCRILIGRFYWALGGGSGSGEDDCKPECMARNGKPSDERVRRIVRVRTFVAIRYWMLTFWTVDFVPNRELRLLLADCLNRLIKDPVLKKHGDGVIIVRRLLKVARECRQAHLRPMPDGSGSGSQDQSSAEVSSPEQTSVTHGILPAENEDEDEVDLDFLPDSEVLALYGDGYGYGNRYGRASELVGPASAGLVGMPPSTLGLRMGGTGFTTAERMPVAGVGPNETQILQQGVQRLDQPRNRQAALNRVKRTLGRLKRALNSRSTSASGATVATGVAGPEVSVFGFGSGVDSLGVRKGSFPMTSRKEGRGSLDLRRELTPLATSSKPPILNRTRKASAPSRTSVGMSQESSFPPVLPLPLSLPPLSMPLSAPESSSKQQMPHHTEKGKVVEQQEVVSDLSSSEEVGGADTPGKTITVEQGQVDNESADIKVPVIEEQMGNLTVTKAAVADDDGDAMSNRTIGSPPQLPRADNDMGPQATASIADKSSRVSLLSMRKPPEGEDSEVDAGRQGIIEQQQADDDMVQDSPKSEFSVLPDTEGEMSERTESLRSSSTDSFGAPLTTTGGPAPMFANARSAWQFDIVSIDDLSDTSSENHASGPSAPPGLRRPVRRLPKKPLFWPRESVSSMGIISHDSIVSGPSSSGMSSPTGAGLGGKIEPWQLQDLIKSVRADEEEEGGVDAALKRLEGYIDPLKQEENIKNVNDWITSIQRRMETGDYNYDLEGFEENLEELIVFDEMGKEDYHQSVSDTEAPAVSVVQPSNRPSEESKDYERTNGDTPTSPRASQALPLAVMQSPPRGPEAKPSPEDAVPLEILQSRMPALPSPPAMLPLNLDPVPRLHQSFTVSYRADILANHLAMIDRELFMTIRFQELVLDDWVGCQEVNVLDWAQYLKDRARWKAEQRFPEKTSALAAARARFNLLTNFVVSEIVMTPPNARPLVFKKFLTLAYKSYNIQNFNALTAIITGLRHELVSKALGKHWQRIGHQEKRMLQSFTQFISNEDDFRIMRRFIDSVTDGNPFDDNARTASVVSGSVEGKHKVASEQKPYCIPFIGVYLSHLYRLNQLPDLIDPTAPQLAVDINPVTGSFDSPKYPEAFSALAPLPPFIQLEPLINVHKQRQIAAVIKSLVAVQHLASRLHFEIDNKLFQKCLRLRAYDTETLKRVLARYPD